MSLKELIILVPCHSLEDFPTELGDEPAAGLLNAFAVAFHPALLAAADVFPRYRRADEAGAAKEGQLIILPTACKDWVAHGWSEDARRAGATVVSGLTKRDDMLQAALLALPEAERQSVAPELVQDFLALGTVYLMTELLTRHMRNYSHLDEALMQRELSSGARAAIAGDAEAARAHLKRGFEMLQDCREKFYPVECYLIDLCLVIPRLANEAFGTLLQATTPVNLLAQGIDWQEILTAHPNWQEIIRTSWKQDRLELVGGEWAERPTTLMSLDETVRNLQAGRNWYREMFGKAPTAWGRKRFGISPQLPQLLTRLHYTGALHFVMDDGVYPDDELAKLRWQGNDGSTIDAHSRIPLAGDSASSWLRFPVRLSESMDADHTAGVIIARWPEMRTPWLEDLRRAQQYAPVLGKFTTLDRFFRSTDTHGAIHDFKAGRYLSPFLVQSVAKRELDPVSRYVRYWRQQWRFQAIDWCQALTEIFSTAALQRNTDQALANAVLAADPEASSPVQAAATDALQAASETMPPALAKVLTGSTAGPGEGVLIINPLAGARQALVEWPSGTAPVDGPGIKHRQIVDPQAAAIVDLPGCGFQWLPAQPLAAVSKPGAGKVVMAEDLLLRTDAFEVQLGEATGGLAQIRTYRRSPNRLSQQLALRFPHERKFTVTEGETTRESASFYTAMQLRETRILSTGPAYGCIETQGDLFDQQHKANVAHYRQRTTVYRGLPIIRIEIELDTLKTPEGDPWSNYFCARFAWKQEGAVLSASMQEGAQLVTAPRIESPHYLEIADERYRTTIHTPGLAFHRKHGERMLDTILITEGETARKFEFVISIDESYPLAATLAAFSPPVIIPTQAAPPNGGRSGWLFQVGAPNAQLLRLLPLPSQSIDGKGGGFVIRLLETEGKHKTIPVHCFRTPSFARQLDLNGEPISTVLIENDALQVNLAAYELCDVEVRF